MNFLRRKVHTGAKAIIYMIREPAFKTSALWIFEIFFLDLELSNSIAYEFVEGWDTNRQFGLSKTLPFKLVGFSNFSPYLLSLQSKTIFRLFVLALFGIQIYLLRELCVKHAFSPAKQYMGWLGGLKSSGSITHRQFYAKKGQSEAVEGEYVSSTQESYSRGLKLARFQECEQNKRVHIEGLPIGKFTSFCLYFYVYFFYLIILFCINSLFCKSVEKVRPPIINSDILPILNVSDRELKGSQKNEVLSWSMVQDMRCFGVEHSLSLILVFVVVITNCYLYFFHSKMVRFYPWSWMINCQHTILGTLYIAFSIALKVYKDFCIQAGFKINFLYYFLTIQIGYSILLLIFIFVRPCVNQKFHQFKLFKMCLLIASAIWMFLNRQGLQNKNPRLQYPNQLTLNRTNLLVCVVISFLGKISQILAKFRDFSHLSVWIHRYDRLFLKKDKNSVSWLKALSTHKIKCADSHCSCRDFSFEPPSSDSDSSFFSFDKDHASEVFLALKVMTLKMIKVADEQGFLERGFARHSNSKISSMRKWIIFNLRNRINIGLSVRLLHRIIQTDAKAREVKVDERQDPMKSLSLDVNMLSSFVMSHLKHRTFLNDDCSFKGFVSSKGLSEYQDTTNKVCLYPFVNYCHLVEYATLQVNLTYKAKVNALNQLRFRQNQILQASLVYRNLRLKTESLLASMTEGRYCTHQASLLNLHFLHNLKEDLYASSKFFHALAKKFVTRSVADLISEDFVEYIVIGMGGETTNFHQITTCTGNVKLLGYSAEKLRRQDLGILQPDCLSAEHRTIIEASSWKQSKIADKNYWLFLPVKQSDGYLQPIHVAFTVSWNVVRGLEFFGLMRLAPGRIRGGVPEIENDKSEHFLLVDHQGVIQGTDRPHSGKCFEKGDHLQTYMADLSHYCTLLGRLIKLKHFISQKEKNSSAKNPKNNIDKFLIWLMRVHNSDFDHILQILKSSLEKINTVWVGFYSKLKARFVSHQRKEKPVLNLMYSEQLNSLHNPSTSGSKPESKEFDRLLAEARITLMPISKLNKIFFLINLKFLERPPQEPSFESLKETKKTIISPLSLLNQSPREGGLEDSPSEIRFLMDQVSSLFKRRLIQFEERFGSDSVLQNQLLGKVSFDPNSSPLPETHYSAVGSHKSQNNNNNGAEKEKSKVKMIKPEEESNLQQMREKVKDSSKSVDPTLSEDQETRYMAHSKIIHQRVKHRGLSCVTAAFMIPLIIFFLAYLALSERELSIFLKLKDFPVDFSVIDTVTYFSWVYGVLFRYIEFRRYVREGFFPNDIFSKFGIDNLETHMRNVSAGEYNTNQGLKTAFKIMRMIRRSNFEYHYEWDIFDTHELEYLYYNEDNHKLEMKRGSFLEITQYTQIAMNYLLNVEDYSTQPLIGPSKDRTKSPHEEVVRYNTMNPLLCKGLELENTLLKVGFEGILKYVYKQTTNLYWVMVSLFLALIALYCLFFKLLKKRLQTICSTFYSFDELLYSDYLAKFALFHRSFNSRLMADKGVVNFDSFAVSPVGKTSKTNKFFLNESQSTFKTLNRDSSIEKLQKEETFMKTERINPRLTPKAKTPQSKKQSSKVGFTRIRGFKNSSKKMSLNLSQTLTLSSLVLTLLIFLIAFLYKSIKLNSHRKEIVEVAELCVWVNKVYSSEVLMELAIVEMIYWKTDQQASISENPEFSTKEQKSKRALSQESTPQRYLSSSITLDYQDPVNFFKEQKNRFYEEGIKKLRELKLEDRKDRSIGKKIFIHDMQIPMCEVYKKEAENKKPYKNCKIAMGGMANKNVDEFLVGYLSILDQFVTDWNLNTGEKERQELIKQDKYASMLAYTVYDTFGTQDSIYYQSMVGTVTHLISFVDLTTEIVRRSEFINRLLMLVSLSMGLFILAINVRPAQEGFCHIVYFIPLCLVDKNPLLVNRLKRSRQTSFYFR